MSLKQRNTLQIWKNAVRYALVQLDFFSFYLFVLTLVMKLKDANYKSH